jgi:hypothetical protein
LLNIIANINRRLAYWEESKSNKGVFCNVTDKFVENVDMYYTSITS